MEPVQVLLFSVVILLTALLFVVGLQAFFILRDVRKTIQKLNGILEDANTLSSAVARPVAGISDLLKGLRDLGGLVQGSSQKQIQVPDTAWQNPEPVHENSYQINEFQTPSNSFSSGRFFHKEGKPLSS